MTKHDAVCRLVGRWLDHVTDNPTSPLRNSLRELLDPDNIEAVQRLDLYAEYDVRQERRMVIALGYDEARAQEMIKAWLRPKITSQVRS